MATKTKQSDTWRGEFGAAYTDRNTFDLAGLDAHYRRLYGVGRLELNEAFIGDFERGISILEVGCNTGNQLLGLRHMGFTDLSAIELQPNAAARARARLPGATILEGQASELPFEDGAFDLVFTSGVLIHIAPDELLEPMSEIHRVSRRHIWGFEYLEADFVEIPYRSHGAMMWKGPYVETYLASFPDLKLRKQQRLDYLDDDNTDVMYLLEKRRL